MKRSVVAAALLLACAALTAPALSRIAPSGDAGTPKQENQFSTVDEFVKARRAARTPVSVEGYVVIGSRAADGGIRLALTDSVDHVLNARDANLAAKAGATVTAPGSDVRKHARWAWTAKGIQPYALYAGTTAGQAVRALHDTVVRTRVTGLAAGKAAIRPITRIEVTDENGEWKRL